MLQIYLCYFFQLVLIFGSFLGHFGNFGSFLGQFGQFWVIFGLFWVILGHFWAIFWCLFFVAKYASVLFKSLFATLAAFCAGLELIAWEFFSLARLAQDRTPLKLADNFLLWRRCCSSAHNPKQKVEAFSSVMDKARDPLLPDWGSLG